MPLFPGRVAANQTPDVPSGEGGDGYFHVDIAEVQAAEGKLYLFVAIGRTSRFACVELHLEAGKMVAAAFLRNLTAAVPCRIHIVLTEALLVRHRFKPNGGASSSPTKNGIYAPSSPSSTASAGNIRSGTGPQGSSTPGRMVRSSG